MLNFFLTEDFKLINNILQENKRTEFLKDCFKFPMNEIEEFLNYTTQLNNNEQVMKAQSKSKKYDKRFGNLYKRFDISAIKSKLLEIISKVFIHIKL
jgi:hypothetical protein